MKIRTVALAATSLTLAACASGTSVPGVESFSDAQWRALVQPAVSPLPEAPAVSTYEVTIGGAWPGPTPDGATLSIGVTELVSAGLMRRRDVAFAERRRFTPAAEAERRGQRQPNAPSAGVGPRVDHVVQATWVPVTGDRSSVEVQLVSPGSGAIAGGTRVQLGPELDPVILARAIVSATLTLLDEVGSRPEWSDPLAANAAGAPGVSTDAIENFFVGVAAEDRWRWDAARRGYASAATDPGFHEASTLLARTARLRLGGTLGEN